MSGAIDVLLTTLACMATSSLHHSAGKLHNFIGQLQVITRRWSAHRIHCRELHCEYRMACLVTCTLQPAQIPHDILHHLCVH